MKNSRKLLNNKERNKALTNDTKPGIGSDGLVQPRRSHLALVLGIVLQGGVANPQIVNAMSTVAYHRIPGESWDDRRETCKINRKLIRPPLPLNLG